MLGIFAPHPTITCSNILPLKSFHAPARNSGPRPHATTPD